MKKLTLVLLASLYAGGALAAAHSASPSADKAASGNTADKNKAAVVADEKVGNDKDKALVKKATPQAKQSAKEAADKTEGKTAKGNAKSDSTAK